MPRILVADDEELERRALRLILESIGMPGLEVQEAANGREAVDLASSSPPDAAFLDIAMPGLDGLGAAREIRASSPGLPVVFLTAFDSFDFAREALRLGVEDYLLKPASREEVEAALRQALGRRARDIEESGPFAAAAGASAAPEREAPTATAGPGLEGARSIEERVAYMSRILAERIREDLGSSKVPKGAFLGFAALSARGAVPEEDAVGALAIALRADPGSAAEPGREPSSAGVTKLRGLATLAERLLRSRFVAALAGSGEERALALALAPSPAEAEAALEEATAEIREAARRELGLAVLAGGSAGRAGELEELGRAAIRAARLAKTGHPSVALRASAENEALGAGRSFVERAVRIMEERLGEELALPRVAAELRLSPSHLSRLFGRHLGTGFGDCLARIRVDRAKGLIAAGASVKEAAALVGFRDPAYFTRVFRRLEGRNPGEFK